VSQNKKVISAFNRESSVYGSILGFVAFLFSSSSCLSSDECIHTGGSSFLCLSRQLTGHSYPFRSISSSHLSMASSFCRGVGGKGEFLSLLELEAFQDCGLCYHQMSADFSNDFGWQSCVLLMGPSLE